MTVTATTDMFGHQQTSVASKPRFLWGVSTSSFQVEGAAHIEGRGDSIWDTYCRQQGRVKDGHTGDIACDHYHRYAEDVALMRDMGIDAYRFSIAWPRILPRGRGAPNEPGLAFYDRLIDTLLEAEIEPWICLYHWDLPQALQEFGGWTNRDSAGWFSDYAALVARRYGDRVKRFATFNEPNVFTLFGYGFGWHAPGIADRNAVHKAIHHVNLSHGAAVDVLRSIPDVSIGAIHNRQPCYPAGPDEEDRKAALAFAEYWNDAFPYAQQFARYPAALAEAIEPFQKPGDMALIARPVDWFGLNHYSPHYIKADKSQILGCTFGPIPPNVPKTSNQWAIVPDAFRDTLLDIDARFRVPIYVLENGTAVDDKLDDAGAIRDTDRIAYLEAYTTAMQEAISAGADVRGYFVWSLLDNYEWTAGYSQRFGLVYVDFATQRRIPKESAGWYAAFIKAGRVLQIPAASGKPIRIAAAAEHDPHPDSGEQLPAASAVQIQ